MLFDKRYQVDRTFFTVKIFSNHVEAASRIILIRLQRPERAWVCGVRCRRAAGCRVGRPFSGGRHGRVAFPAHALRFRRAFPACARRASGAGDAVNGKYEKKTVTVRILAHISERSDKVPHQDINER